MVNDVISRLREAETRTQPPRPFDLDASLRQARGRARRRRAWQAGAGLVASAAVVAGVTAAWPDGQELSPRPADTAAPPVDPRERLSLLNEPRDADDEPPAEFLRGNASVSESLVESTVHLVAEWDGVHFWVGLDRENYACLLMAAPEDLSKWMMTCGGMGDEGIMGSGAVGEQYVEARLLPDGYVRDPDELAEWYFVTPNLAVKRD